MKQAGTAFTYGGRRYEAGSAFDLSVVPAHLRGTLTRLYGLTEKKPKYFKKESS